MLAAADEVMGEKFGALLCEERVDVPAVLEHCREQLADYKIPQYVTVVTTPLPRHAGGKLLKDKLREQIRWGRRCGDRLPEYAASDFAPHFPFGALHTAR